MSNIHNHATCVASVHKIPAEILAGIFYLVSPNHCHKYFPTDDPPRSFIQYPDCLTHVCSRWREVALSFPSFRTRDYNRRAGKLSLDVHLDDKGCMSDNSFLIDSIVSHLASRTKSLDFIITTPELLHFHRFVFDSMLPALSSKIFKTLRMSCEVSLPDPFITGRDSDPWLVHGSDDSDEYDWGPNMLRWDGDVIDDSFSGVRTLHLQGVFFNWSGKLYHGLVDLRLTAPPIGKATDMDVYTLMSILSNSPGLRIFHFSLELVTDEGIDDERLYKEPIHSVFLPDLEVIQVSTARAYLGKHPSFHAGSLLQLIAPGSKSLRLTIETGSDQNEPLFNSDGMKAFLARSKVEKLCVKNGYPSVDEMRLCHLPDLKVLVFDCCRRISVYPAPNPSFKLPTCFIHDGALDLEKLRSMVELCPAGLVLSMCDVVRCWNGGQTNDRIIPEAVLRAAFPTHSESFAHFSYWISINFDSSCNRSMGSEHCIPWRVEVPYPTWISYKLQRKGFKFMYKLRN
ncbi:hypothetical protein B0J17DRAFT_678320 [Rhizoctonia solani]|nr:hypothetical protein B0J17DRAFT_678320 [Rhizoctonia solani]